tara:strand:- start:810 stop:1016 length:207 start_codon:yes stop_codon:yes gene_type:complete
MKIGDLVRWKNPEHRTTEFKGKFGIVVGIGQLNHLGANKLPKGAFIHWPGKGVYWSPIAQLEIISKIN